MGAGSITIAKSGPDAYALPETSAYPGPELI